MFPVDGYQKQGENPVFRGPKGLFDEKGCAVMREIKVVAQSSRASNLAMDGNCQATSQAFGLKKLRFLHSLVCNTLDL